MSSTSPSRAVAAFGLLAALCLVGSTTWTARRGQVALREAERLAAVRAHHRDLAETVSRAVHAQAHAWKNAVLRGHDYAIYSRYREAFNTEGRRIRDVVGLLEAIADTPELATRIDGFRMAHDQCTRRAEAAFDALGASQGMAKAAADRELADADRLPATLSADLVAALAARGLEPGRAHGVSADVPMTALSTVTVSLVAFMRSVQEAAASLAASADDTLAAGHGAVVAAQDLSVTVDAVARLALGERRHALSVESATRSVSGMLEAPDRPLPEARGGGGVGPAPPRKPRRLSALR